MKIKITIDREFDTSDDTYEDLAGIDLEKYFLNLFADDIDNLVKYNEVREAARVEVIS